MCCGLLSCLTCCGLCTPRKKCCCIIPLRCGVLIFAIIFIILDGVILVAYAERMIFFQNIKKEANNAASRALLIKEDLDTKANPRFLKGAEPAMEDGTNKVSGAAKAVIDAVKHLGNNKMEKRSNIFEWKSDRMARFLDMFGFDHSPNDVSFSSWETWRRVFGPKKISTATPSPDGRFIKASWMSKRGIFWSEETIRNENQDLGGSKTFKKLFALQIENIVLAVIWWCMAWYLLICGACNLKCCAWVWVIAMLVRLVEIVIHAFIVGYSCWWLKHCGKLVFPNILSIVMIVFIPYAIIIVISWIVSK